MKRKQLTIFLVMVLTFSMFACNVHAEELIVDLSRTERLLDLGTGKYYSEQSEAQTVFFPVPANANVGQPTSEPADHPIPITLDPSVGVSAFDGETSTNIEPVIQKPDETSYGGENNDPSYGGGEPASEPPVIVCLHHNTETRDYVAPSCNVPGYSGNVYCTDCGEIVAYGHAIQTIAHAASMPLILNEVPATISSNGEYDEVIKCLNCGLVLSNKHIVTDKLVCNHSHTYAVNVKDATCSAEGYSGDQYCSDCGKLISNGTKIAKSEHKAGSKIIANEVKATTTANGGYDEIVKCTVCGVVISQKHVTIPKLTSSNDQYVVKAQEIYQSSSTEREMLNGIVKEIGSGVPTPAGGCELYASRALKMLQTCGIQCEQHWASEKAMQDYFGYTASDIQYAKQHGRYPDGVSYYHTFVKFTVDGVDGFLGI